VKIPKLILLSAIIFVAGCGASGPPFSPVQNPDISKAMVYIYFPFSLFDWPVEPSIYIDGVEYGKLRSNGYLVYTIDPGTRIIEAKSAKVSLAVYPEFVAGNEYYIRWLMQESYTVATIRTEYSLKLVPKEYAIQEIVYTKKSQ
jgi:hypothetical protein